MKNDDVKVGDRIRITSKDVGCHGDTFRVRKVYDNSGKVDTLEGPMYGDEYEIVSRSTDEQLECIAVGGAAIDRDHERKNRETMHRGVSAVHKTSKTPAEMEQHLKNQLDENLRRAFG